MVSTFQLTRPTISLMHQKATTVTKDGSQADLGGHPDPSGARGDADRRRFGVGFVFFGSAAIAGYIVSRSRPARWSLVSALLPFQTGLMLAPDVGKSWKAPSLGGILVDTTILALLPIRLSPASPNYGG
jgi:hypothetical protein